LVPRTLDKNWKEWKRAYWKARCTKNWDLWRRRRRRRNNKHIK